MAAPTRTPDQILAHREQIAARYLRGEYQADIARALGISQQQISKDLAAIRAAWLASAGLTVVSGYTTTATTRISGGTLGSDYSLTCTLTFTSGQILPCVYLVQVRER